MKPETPRRKTEPNAFNDRVTANDIYEDGASSEKTQLTAELVVGLETYTNIGAAPAGKQFSDDGARNAPSAGFQPVVSQPPVEHTPDSTKDSRDQSRASVQTRQGAAVITARQSAPAVRNSIAGRWIAVAIALISTGAYLWTSYRTSQEQRTVLSAPSNKLTQSVPVDGIKAHSMPLSGADLRLLVSNVADATEGSVRELLAIASTGDSNAINAAALAAGRQFEFGGYNLNRDRKSARALNSEALRAFYEERGFSRAYELQKKAFAADPLDIEVAGNLAVFALRTGNKSDARDYVLYALGLPRSSTKPGRTTDWSTLAAVYAEDGDHTNAQNALFVTLGMTSNVGKRCSVAVHSVNKTYGPALRRATEAMFERVRDARLSNASECALPIAWQ